MRAYKSRSEWLRKNKGKDTVYVRYVKRKIKSAPYASIREILRLPLRDLDLSRKLWNLLTPEQKVEKVKSLEAVRLMRRKNFKIGEASKKVNMSIPKILRYAKDALIKVKHWFAKPVDTLERPMRIYENGEVKTILVNNSETASLIGQYHSAVGRFLSPEKNGNEMKPFEHVVITDSQGIKHTLETNWQKLKDIDDAREDSEFFEIYDDKY